MATSTKKDEEDFLKVDPQREAFESHIRRINPDVLFVKRSSDGKYRNISIEHMWQGYLLGVTDGPISGHVAAV